MLDGWYCRAKAAEDATSNSTSVENNHNSQNYRKKYKELKKKLKYLLYENEFFKESLRENQQQLLKVSRDRSYLLDRLLQYENPESASDGDSDTSTEEPSLNSHSLGKKRKMDGHIPGQNSVGKRPDGLPKRKYTKHKQIAAAAAAALATNSSSNDKSTPILQDISLSTEAVQRHLELKQFETLETTMETVPNEMFSSESSNMEETECLSMDNMIMSHETVPYMEN